MGEQMRIFQNKRIWSVVLLENVPQIILQTIHLFQTNELSSITIMALSFSVFSIILSILVYSTQASISKHQTIAEADIKSVSFEGASKEVAQKSKALKYQRKKLIQKLLKYWRLRRCLLNN